MTHFKPFLTHFLKFSLFGESYQDNETQGKNDTDIITNNSEKENSNSQKSGIGWLGIFLIILLSLIVIYVVYVGFRYYRRKKYQNPSFYYKITEEMFDDITPIE